MGTCCLAALQAATWQVWGACAFVPLGCPRGQALPVPRPTRSSKDQGAQLRGGSSTTPRGRGGPQWAGKVGTEPAVLTTSPDPSAAATARPHTARPSRTFHATLGAGPPLRSSDPGVVRATAHKHGSPGLRAINNPDRFNKYRRTTAICGEFMRN